MQRLIGHQLVSLFLQRPAESPIQKAPKLAKLVEEEAEEDSEESDEEEEEMELASPCKMVISLSFLFVSPPMIIEKVQLLYTF